MSIIGDLVSEEVRSRLDGIPHLLLRLACSRLPRRMRRDRFDEWTAELHEILRGDEARPVTRLVRGVKYSFGLLRTAPRVAGEFESERTMPWTRNLLWLVLLIGGGTDAATFFPVVAPVLRSSTTLIVWITVIGFTCVALTLPHQAGLELRQRHDSRDTYGSVTLSVASLGAWFLLGAVALVVRYMTAVSTGSVGIDAPGATPPLLPALLFSTLYVATGTVAGLTGYVRSAQDPDKSNR